jgi:hypothetical protein
MAACKAALDAARGIAHSTMVTTMARNSVEFGIQVSSVPGATWFTEPAQEVIGPMFAGYKREDAGLEIGGQRDHGDLPLSANVGFVRSLGWRYRGRRL